MTTNAALALLPFLCADTPFGTKGVDAKRRGDGFFAVFPATPQKRFRSLARAGYFLLRQKVAKNHGAGGGGLGNVVLPRLPLPLASRAPVARMARSYPETKVARSRSERNRLSGGEREKAWTPYESTRSAR